jgi:hypothetical protein
MIGPGISHELCFSAGMAANRTVHGTASYLMGVFSAS